MNRKFLNIKRAIKKAGKIALFCHIDPDFDCLCSMYGLGLALKSTQKKVDMFTHEKFSENQKALLDFSLASIGNFNPAKYDLLISVDTPEKDRLGMYGDAFFAHPNTIKLDHHPASERLAKIEYIDEKSTSCAEIILKLLQYLKITITPEIATILYAGLSADTNSFVNTNVNQQSFKNALELVKKKADVIKVNNAYTRMQSLVKLRINKIFFRNFQIYNKEIAISTISHRELLSAGAEKRDAEGLSNQLLTFCGINIACMIVEREPHEFYLSFRSMPGFDVSIIAQHLNGGGHKEAAGGTLHNVADIKTAKKIVLTEIKKYLRERKANGQK